MQPLLTKHGTLSSLSSTAWLRYATSLLVVPVCLLLTACPPQRPPSADSKPPLKNDLGIPPDAGIPTTAEEREMYDKTWLEVGITESDVRNLLTERCYKDDDEFLSCVVGVYSAFASVDSRILFAPKAYFENSPYEVLRVVREFGEFDLAEVKSKKTVPEKSLRAIYENAREDRKIFFTSIKARRIFRDIPFQEVSELLLSLGRAKWAEKAATFVYRDFLNAYLSVRDSISNVEPIAYMNWRQTKTGSSQATIAFGALVDGALLVKHVPKGSGAERAGLLQGDRILGFNGLRFSDATLSEVIMAIQANADSVLAEVRRRDGRTELITIPITSLAIPILEYKKVVHKGKEYRYVKIESFDSKKLCELLTQKIREDLNSPVAGYIIDVRGNPGGLVDQAACVTGTFVGKGRTLIFEKSILGGEQNEIKTTGLLDAQGANRPDQVPLVVLTDGQSASASEAFAAAIRDYSRGFLVGLRTFGKGSVNSGYYFDPPRNKLVLWKTRAVFYSPSKKTHNRVGLLPDIKVSWRTGATEDEDFAVTSEYLDSNPTRPENPAIGPKDPAGVKQVESCLDRDWILKEEKAKFGTREESDLQFYYGLETLRCL